MRHANLSGFFIASPVILVLLLLSGCGGGDEPGYTVAPLVRESRYVGVDTGAVAVGRSNLGVVRVETLFLPLDAQRLTTRWNPSGQEQPPPRFQVQVTRFFDADGTTGKAIGEPMDADYFESKSSEFLESPARVLEKGWDFRRPSGNAAPLFAPGGVYIVDVRTPEGGTYNERMQPRLFIAPGTARGSTDDDANGVTVETKDVERENGVQSLNVSTSGLASVARTNDILLSFTPGFGSPAKNWEVFLRRYKEARDGRPYSETAQLITVEEATPTSWRLRRQGNVPLDPHAVYVIEIRRAGSGGGIRHLFTTDGK